jgi:predicted ATPase
LANSNSKLLKSAAMIGREFEFALLGRVFDGETDSMLRCLDEGIEARLLTKVPATLARYRFVHELFREVLYRDLGTAERVRLHRGVRHGGSFRRPADRERA